MSVNMVGVKFKPAKTPQKQSQNLNKKITDSKPHIWSLSFNFRFSSRKSQNQQKLTKKMTHFRTQFHSKNLTYYEPQPTQHGKKYTLATQPKTDSLYKFSRKHVSG